MSIPSNFDKHLAGASILLWQINLLKQSLSVNIHAGWMGFPYDVAKLMKDPSYREAIVSKTDLVNVNQTLASIRKGRSAQTSFHLHIRDTLTHWCLLVGNAKEGDGDEIFGSLICIEMELLSHTRFGATQEVNLTSADQDPIAGSLSEPKLAHLRDQLTKSEKLHDWLDAICQWDSSDAFEAILFSDVQQAKGKVQVYGAGTTFPDLHEGRSYPYEGTIAEMIVSLDLDHVIVDDTMESLKPIDWALFVPHGIRSYFAVPAFESGTIRGVLIFCSSRANHFSEQQKDYFDQIADVMFSTQHLLEKI